MRWWRLGLLLGIVAAAVAPWLPAHADTSTASPQAEAWYATPPTCASPVGCGPTDSIPPASPYPAGTLHVGAVGGVETARTYMQLDLGSLPSGTAGATGTLTIPVLGPDAGTVSPEAAEVQVCLAATSFSPVEGSFAQPPTIDCSATSMPSYAAGPPAVLTVDLQPFIDRWADGEPNNGLVLLPQAPAPGGPTWHVAFAARTATATFDVPPAAEPAATEEDLFVPDTGGGAIGDFFAVPAPPLAAPPASPAAPLLEQIERPATLQPAVFGGPGFAYPAVFAVPLLLLGLGGYLGWALSRPVVVRET